MRKIKISAALVVFAAIAMAEDVTKPVVAPVRPVPDVTKMAVKDAQVRLLSAQVTLLNSQMSIVRSQKEFEDAQRGLNEAVKQAEAVCGGRLQGDLSCVAIQPEKPKESAATPKPEIKK